MQHPIEITSNFPLHAAVQSGDLKTVVACIKKGIDINQEDEKGFAPLHCAVQEGRASMILEELLECGADTDLKDKHGLTPLHWAVLENRSSILEILLLYKLDINSETHDDFTPLDLAIDEGRVFMVEILLKYGGATVKHRESPNVPTELARIYNEKILRIKKFSPDHSDIYDIYLPNAQGMIPYDAIPEDLQEFANQRYFDHQQRADSFPSHWNAKTSQAFLILRHKPVFQFFQWALNSCLAFLPFEIKEMIAIELCILHLQEKCSKNYEFEVIEYKYIAQIRNYLHKKKETNDLDYSVARMRV